MTNKEKEKFILAIDKVFNEFTPRVNRNYGGPLPDEAYDTLSDLEYHIGQVVNKYRRIVWNGLEEKTSE